MDAGEASWSYEADIFGKLDFRSQDCNSETVYRAVAEKYQTLLFIDPYILFI